MNTIAGSERGTAAGEITERRRVRSRDAAIAPLSLTTLWTILRFTYGLVPIVAGLDKFTNLLVQWDRYLNPTVLSLLPLRGSQFMGIVGVIEVAAGILTLARPRLGGYVVSAWLACIALSLLASGSYLDVAVRDLVMGIGAFTLANLSALVSGAGQGRQS